MAVNGHNRSYKINLALCVIKYGDTMKVTVSKVYLVLLFGFFAFASLRAQNVKTIMIKTCLDSALANYPSLKAFKKIEAAQSAYTKSLQGQTLPEIDFAFQSVYNVYAPYEYGTLDNQIQIIWDMGKWAGKLRQAGLSEEKIAKYKSLQNKNKLIYQVKHAFYALVIARKTGHISRLSENYLEHQLEINQKLYRLGQIKSLDLYATQTELSRSQEKILTSRAEIEYRQIQLNHYTGLNFTSWDSLIVPDISIRSDWSVLAPLLEQAGRFNPAIRILDAQIERTMVQRNIIKSSRMPKIYLGGGYIFDSDPTSGGNYGNISAGLLLPIFDWGSRHNKAQMAELKSEALRYTKQTLLSELKAELEARVNRINNIKKLLILKMTSIKQAQKSFDLTLINYTSGLATNTELLLAQKALIESKISKQKIVFSLYEVQSQMENLIGLPEGY